MNALLYHIASGQAFFSGVALIHLAALLAIKSPGRARKHLRRIVSWLGLLLVAVSATPLPAWFYAAAVSLWLLAIAASSRLGNARPRLRRCVLTASLLIWWVGIALELPFHRMPSIPPMNDPTLIVVGEFSERRHGG